MKKMNIKSIFIFLTASLFFCGCYKLQKDYQYVKYELDPHINMTAKDYLVSRGKAGTGADTIFKWMQLGIEYAGIDMAEYEKPARTYILLHTNAIRTLSSGKVNGGFFFDYPIVVRDSTGTPIKSKLDPTLDSLRPAVSWNEYPQQMVKNYLLYLIVEGEYGFNNLTVPDQSLPTLMPANAVASAADSKLGWVVTKTTPNPDYTAISFITFNPTGGTGFDPEGKINLKIGNNDQSPIVVNDRINDRSAGYIATNGQIHVFDKTIHPFRYSW
jgi:hypothetical protein